MLTLFVILAFIFIVLIACVPTEKNSKDAATNSYEEWGKRTLLALILLIVSLSVSLFGAF